MAPAPLAAPAPLLSVPLLGGRRVLQVKPRSPLDWVAIIRHGIPAAAFESLLQVIRISQVDLAAALGIPERTLARRKREGRVDWLKSPNAALKRITPLSLLDTDIGAETVMDTLGRIEHGVFA